MPALGDGMEPLSNEVQWQVLKSLRVLLLEGTEEVLTGPLGSSHKRVVIKTAS